MGDDVILHDPWNLRGGGDDCEETSGRWALAVTAVCIDAADGGFRGGHRFLAVLSAADQKSCRRESS